MPILNAVRAADSFAAKIFPDPFILAGQILFTEISQRTNQQAGSEHRISFIVDENPGSENFERVYLEFKRINPGLQNIQGLTHLDDKVAPPLQVADMMASIAKEMFLEANQDGTTTAVPKRLTDSIAHVNLPNKGYFLAVLENERKRRDAGPTAS